MWKGMVLSGDNGLEQESWYKEVKLINSATEGGCLKTYPCGTPSEICVRDLKWLCKTQMTSRDRKVGSAGVSVTSKKTCITYRHLNFKNLTTSLQLIAQAVLCFLLVWEIYLIHKHTLNLKFIYICIYIYILIASGKLPKSLNEYHWSPGHISAGKMNETVLGIRTDNLTTFSTMVN